MSFDMRPALLADSRLNLMMFSAVDSFEAVDEVVRRMGEPIERIDLEARINQLRCMYWTYGTFIWVLPASKMLK